MKPVTHNLTRILARQGFGTRKECVRMLKQGDIRIGHLHSGGFHWETATDPDIQVELAGLYFKAGSLELPFKEELHLVMNKPAGTECSHRPKHHPSVFTLLPPPFLNRGVQCVGRLDADTTGMLLLSDSGDFNHHFTSPKRQKTKKYRVSTKHPLSEIQIRELLTGVKLKDEDALVHAVRVNKIADKTCDMVLTEGKYHQVKRMLAAAGNHVEQIHRTAIGEFTLPEDLQPGEWRILTHEQLKKLGYPSN